MRIILAADRAGVEMKDRIAEYLEARGHEVTNVRDAAAEVHYPDAAVRACTEVQSGRQELAVLVCGTGIGMSITANKFDGIRAALVCDEYSARMSASHNAANVLCFGARTQGLEKVLGMLDAFFSEDFLGGRHAERVRKIAEIEKNRQQNK